MGLFLHLRHRHLLVPLLGLAVLAGAVTAAAADPGAVPLRAWSSAISSHLDLQKSPEPSKPGGQAVESPGAQPKIVSPGKPIVGNPVRPTPIKVIPCIAAGSAAPIRPCPCPPAYAQAASALVCWPCPRLEAAAPTILCRPCPLTAGPANALPCRPCPYVQGAAIACRPVVTPPAGSAGSAPPKAPKVTTINPSATSAAP